MRFFRLLLRLFPRAFRDDFGPEMEEVFKSQQRERARAHQASGLGFWLRTTWGVLVTAPGQHLESFWQDCRFAVRLMARRPLFTLVSVLSLSIGIGASTTVVSVFQATFLKTIPGLERPEELVNVDLRSDFDDSFRRTSYPNYRDLSEGKTGLAGLAGFNGLGLSLEMGGEPTVVPSQVVTGNYFEVLGVRPRRGRFFAPDEGLTAGTLPVAVVSSWFWENRMEASESVLGTEIRLNGTPFSIVGVAAEGFRGHFIGFTFDIFIHASMSRVAGLPDPENRDSHWVELVGRLDHHTTLQQAQSALARGARRLAESFPASNRGLQVAVAPTTGFDEGLRGGLLIFLVIMMGTSLLVLMIACANVANMMLSRLVARTREMALRLAIGAGRSRLVAQLLTESLLVALMAGGLGILLAFWATGVARSAIPEFGGAVSLDIRLDATALSWGLLISLLTALSFGVIPTLKSSRLDLVALIKRGAQPGVRKTRFRGALVIGQVALSTVVLVCAGLFLRALQHASTLDPGFDMQDVEVVQIDPSLLGLDRESSRELLNRIMLAVRSVPGLEAAAYVNRVPLSLGARFFSNPLNMSIDGRQPEPGRRGIFIEHARVSGPYFELMKIPLLEGRVFQSSDRRDSRMVALVNRSFVRRFWPSESVIGKTFVGDEASIEVVGVVADSKYRTLDEAARPFIYLPFAQGPGRRGVLLTRSRTNSDSRARELRQSIRGIAPYLPLSTFTSLEDHLGLSLLPQRVAGVVTGSLGLVALLLAAIGLYGVIAHSVESRRHEIGVRISLGARPADVIGSIMKRGLALALIGVLIGVAVAIAVSQLLASFLVGLDPIDIPTFAAIVLLLLSTAAAAGYFPAGRASRVDPLRVLRAE